MPVLRRLVLLAVGASCARSIVIRADDPTFVGAQERLVRTAARVSAEAPADEAVAFLQAEALFRYRYAPPSRSLGSYVAQGLAAAIDFPALQALAGAMDLFELRLRATDGAAQLWETFLVRRPASKLRPLVLYRLGWAYRYVVAPGFPRGSADAFDALIRDHGGSPLVPLAREAKAVRWKSPDTATAWSIVPGLGHVYAGEVQSGLVRLSIALVAAAMIVVPSVIAVQRREELAWPDDWPLLAVGLGGVIVLSIDYSLSYEDALRATMEFNERQEARFEQRHPEAP